MIQHPAFDPVAISFGPIKVQWYGLMYLLGFAAVIVLGCLRAKKNEKWNLDQVWDMLFYGAMGVVLGGRLGYVLFYKLEYYLAHPLEILSVWQGGMSFHGGLFGVIVALWFFAKKTNKTFFEVMDFVAPLTPIGLGAGRVGNFINQELWGRVSDVPWAVHFPSAGALARHPSQLYESLLEGFVLFLVLWIYSSKPRAPGKVSGVFLIGYAASRCFVEFFREPDAHLGYLAFDWLTMGQVLSLPMLILGFWLVFIKNNEQRETTA